MVRAVSRALNLASPQGEGGAQAVAGQFISEADRATEPRVIGLDLSLTATGVAGKDFAEVITPPKNIKGYERLRFIDADVMDLFARGADLTVVEGLAYAAHDTNRAGAGLWWLITYHLWKRGYPFVVVPPASRAKYATGKGNANKDTVLASVVRRFPSVLVDNNNAADALVLAAMGYDYYGHPLAVMPETHRAALAAVDWPELVAS